MNLITCSEDCVFQQEGYCTLAYGAPVSVSHPPSGCFHYQPRVAERPAEGEKPGDEP